MYSIGVAGTVLGACVKVFRKWHVKGLITCYRTVGGHRRFPLNELLRITEGREVSTPPITRLPAHHIDCFYTERSYSSLTGH